MARCPICQRHHHKSSDLIALRLAILRTQALAIRLEERIARLEDPTERRR